MSREENKNWLKLDDSDIFWDVFFFFQAEDGIRDIGVTGVQTCALPILAGLGDSLVVVGVDTPSGREWNVHVHVADVGAAIEAGIEAGRPYRISVTPLAPVAPSSPVPGTRAVVAVVSSDGLAALFSGEGVRVVACGPDGVQEDDVLQEVLASTAHEVVVLPNDAALLPVAGRAATRARETGRDVGVVPTR